MITLILAAALSTSAHADDGDVNIDTAALPAPVSAAFAAKWPGATLDAAEQEGANYEVKFHADGKPLEAKFDATGAWLETEVIIAVTDAPAEVQATLTSKYGKWTVTKVEAETTATTSKFEAHLARGEKGLEVEMDAKGVVLATEKKELEEDDDKHEGEHDDKHEGEHEGHGDKDDDGDEH